MARITTLLIFLMLSITNSFAAMNGQFKGNIDGNVIDIPVSCDFGNKSSGGLVSVKSDNFIKSAKDNNKYAVDLTFLGSKQFVAMITMKDKDYRFGGKHEVSGSSFSYKGALKSKRSGDYKVDFIVSCNK